MARQMIDTRHGNAFSAKAGGRGAKKMSGQTRPPPDLFFAKHAKNFFGVFRKSAKISK
jgi:hypothetical protein